jgi:hypothetical protein
MELDPSGAGVAINETRRLIASSKVEGTPVFNRTGEQLGSVYNFMVDKISGQVAYVVMSFGGFLGIGESYHPLPWRALTYDTRLGGYVVDIDKDRLVGAPRYGPTKTRSQTMSTEPRLTPTTERHQRSDPHCRALRAPMPKVSKEWAPSS